jgi:replicative DNA helicase
VALFDAKRTKQQLLAVYKQGLLQSEPYWNFGYPVLNQVVCDLKRGLWFLIAPENVGKSMFMLNLGYNVLKHNEKGYWLDFSLDDSTEDRIGYLLARTGDMPISLVKRAGAAPQEEKEKRQQAFQAFNQNYGDRYCLEALTDADVDQDEDLSFFTVERICRLIGEARKELGEDAKLFVTVDGFHDLETAASDECERQKRKSQMLKKCSSKFNALVLLSAHTRKDSRRRNMTADIMKGEDTPAFDGKIISHLYSDVNLNRDLADVYWEDEAQPGMKLPVHELDILKNKGGHEKRVIFYHYLPSRCWDSEADADLQELYQGMIFKKAHQK